MPALLILHGLFLLHCNWEAGSSTLDKHTCEILAIQDSLHSYQVLAAGGTYQSLADSTNLKITGLQAATASADRNNLDQRILTLNQKFATINRTPASTRIVIPMPDDIFGANRVRGSLTAVLNGTPAAAIRSQPDANGYIPLAESLVLSYSSGSPFTLTGGTGVNVNSVQNGGFNVMALFAWPVSLDQNNCNNAPLDHPAMNTLVDLAGGLSPTIVSLNVPIEPDTTANDQGMGQGLNIDSSFLHPMCTAPDSSKSNAKARVPPKNRGDVHIFTASHTGCALEVYIE